MDHADKKDKDIDKYKEDIETIKALLIQVEEKPLFEHWIFVLGSICSWTTTLAIYWTIKNEIISFATGIVIMWVLLFTVGCTSEFVSRLRKTTAEALPLFPRPIIKMYGGLIGSCLGFAFITIMLLLTHTYTVIPAILLISGAVFYLFYAQMAYIPLFFHSFIMLILSVILYFSNLAVLTQLLLAGIIISISVTFVGVHEWRNEKKANAE